MTKKVKTARTNSSKNVNTKNVKSSAARAKTARAAGRARSAQAQSPVDQLPPALSALGEAATKSLNLSLGLGIQLFDIIQQMGTSQWQQNFYENLNTLVDNATARGEKFRKQQRARLIKFQQQQFERASSLWAQAKQ